MPQTIGRYEIQRKFGEGGMAVVYLAHDPNFDRTVVVKVIQREYSGLAEFRARFSREAKVIAALEHEAIVPVHDFGEHDGQPFIVMRYLTGGTLADRMGHGPLPLPEVARIVERIADALDYAHSRGVIHRDLKPGNILFDERGKAYLSDFGIAKLADATMKLTGTGIIGTPAYMSPEQARANTELD
ncbi:MAG: serine/threonine-protein kinase, partial [Chloroflexota bacterium]